MKIGGEAGQGVQTIGDTLTKVFSRAGYHVFSHQDYESRVRGGHNFYQIRLADLPVSASRKGIDLIVAFDETSITRHECELTDGGVLLYDPASHKGLLDKPHFLAVPFLDIALQNGGSRVMANTAAIGAVMGILGLPIERLFGVLEVTLAGKDEKTLEVNRKVATAGHQYAGSHCTRCAFSLGSSSGAKMLIDGNEAVGFGAVASGCKFYAAYPMTPSTGIMVSVAQKAREYGIVVEQAEDEISAINMALGASFGGVRAMTGSSGGGFALMVEGLSLSGMTETPLVVALAQRPGPATGFPTRTEQGELLFALHAGHGEFARVVFAPGSPEQAFYLTNKAFELSQKYQLPALILTDQYFADSQWTYEGFDLERITYNDRRLKGQDLAGPSIYKRHALTENGVSPFGVPGDTERLIVTDSDEHTEEGHITEDAAVRVAMVRKRLFQKLSALKKEIAAPLLYGRTDAEVVLVGWGSMYGILKEVVDVMIDHTSIAMLHFSELYPFPDRAAFDYMALLNKARITICVEQNGSSQFSRLVRAETGYEFTDHVNRCDGRPFMLEELRGEIDARLR
ncbi:MAG TPA: 2-oxoacid:acceptor oxidoreductase subunit alpha [Syntrophorhabdaceae bacterium]|nr:2-oxoacid:acceptor oxidoreductase subunit alpha [Syntrophorhabdaceae bacterium]